MQKGSKIVPTPHVFSHKDNTFKHINLLPLSTENIKRKRRTVILMVAIVATIFLCMILLTHILKETKQRVQIQAHVASTHIFAADDAPLMLALELAQLQDTMFFFDNYFYENAPVDFNISWIDIVTYTLPQGARIERVNYNKPLLYIFAYANNTDDIDMHKLAITESGYFQNVALTSISRHDTGIFFYELRLAVPLRTQGDAAYE